jgi:hypothetical protein
MPVIARSEPNVSKDCLWTGLISIKSDNNFLKKFTVIPAKNNYEYTPVSQGTGSIQFLNYPVFVPAACIETI